MGDFEKFIDDIYELSQSDDITSMREQVYSCMIDFTSAIIGGNGLWKDRVSPLVENDFESGEFNVVGFSKTTSLQAALLSNGLLSHVAELDDGVIDGIIHPGAPIFTAIFTAFQKREIEWKLFVKAVVVGYEVACRISEAIQPGHKLLGYHASGTCGTLGVTMALAVLAHFDKKRMRNALAVSLASSHGTLKVLEDESELKPYNIASAVINGFVAFQMAKAGFEVAKNPFEGEAGFFTQMAKEVNYGKLTINKDRLCISRAYFKPYASCRYTHPAIEAGMKIRELYGLQAGEIKDIEIATYSIAMRHHDHTEIPNISSAKMCIPFAAAVGVLKGSGGIDAFSEDSLLDTEVKSLTRKVHVVENPEYSRQFPEQSMATMTVTTKNSKQYSYTISCPKGEPKNPMTQCDLFVKLKNSCRYANFDYLKIKEYVQTIKCKKINDYFGNINKAILDK